MNVAIITPIFGERQTAHGADKWTLSDYPIIAGGLSPHDRSRGYLASRAMKTEAERHLWIDADIEVTEAQARSLVDVSVETGADIVVGCYPCRHAAERGQLALNFNVTPLPGETDLHLGFGPNKGRLVPIHSCGFGLVVMHRRLLEIPFVPEVVYTDHDGNSFEGRAWFLPIVRGDMHYGEDRSFCIRLRESKAEHRMLADTRVSVSHAGYTIERLIP